MTNGRRVLIYGAGDKGVMTLREIINNEGLGLTPVGFIDDDVRKHKSRIRGYEVLGGLESLERAVARLGVDEVIVASKKIPSKNIQTTSMVCQGLGVSLRNMELFID